MYHNYRWYHNYSVTYNVFDHTEIQSMCVIYRTHVDPLFRACRKSEMRIRSACPAASYACVSQHNISIRLFPLKSHPVLDLHVLTHLSHLDSVTGQKLTFQTSP